MLAFVCVYRRVEAFVEIHLRGRTNQAVHQFAREHNLRVTQDLRAFAIDAGLAQEATGVILSDCTEEQVSVVLTAGDVLEGDLQPTSELDLHFDMYAATALWLGPQ